MLEKLKFFGIDLSIIALVLANLFPILGVVYFGWNAANIVLLYWLENIVIGVFNVVKMLSLKAALAEKLFMSGFFGVHYGIFAYVHGIFLMTFFKLEAFFDLGIVDVSSISLEGLLWGAAALFVSHGVSLLINFYGRGEYKIGDINTQMFAPYKRVIVMHLVIMLGGGMAGSMGSPMPALIVLILFKIGFDIAAHISAHKLSAKNGEAVS